MKKFFKYFRDAFKELSFVTWPKRDVLLKHSVAVLVFTLVFAGLFWLIDGGMRVLTTNYIEATEPFRRETSTGSTLDSTASGQTIPFDLGDVQVETSPISGDRPTVSN